MNALFRLRKDMYITSVVPFKHILYLALLSNVVPHQDEDSETRYGVYGGNQADLYDQFSDWSDVKDSKDEVLQALNSLFMIQISASGVFSIRSPFSRLSIVITSLLPPKLHSVKVLPRILKKFALLSRDL